MNLNMIGKPSVSVKYHDLKESIEEFLLESLPPDSKHANVNATGEVNSLGASAKGAGAGKTRGGGFSGVATLGKDA